MLFQCQCRASNLLSGLNKFHDSRANETHKIVALFCSVSIWKYYYIFHSWSTLCQDRVSIHPQPKWDHNRLYSQGDLFSNSFELLITGNETGSLLFPFSCLPLLRLHFLATIPALFQLILTQFSSSSMLLFHPSLLTSPGAASSADLQMPHQIPLVLKVQHFTDSCRWTHSLRAAGQVGMGLILCLMLSVK